MATSITNVDVKDCNDSLTGQVVFALHSLYPDGVFYCRLAIVWHRLTHHSEYTDCIPADLGPVTDADAGQAIDLVRCIRNKFANGAAALPKQDDWNGKDSLDNRLVRFSCRLVLMTIQMMLRVYYKGKTFEIEDAHPSRLKRN